jgi:hypothetical protein
LAQGDALENAERCREYPPNNSSAPKPDRNTRAGVRSHWITSSVFGSIWRLPTPDAAKNSAAAIL